MQLRKRLYANNGGSGDLALGFSAPLMSTLAASLAHGSGTPTFTRATTAYVEDFEGLLKPVLSGEARFKGARRVHNKISTTSEAFDNGVWSLGGMSLTPGQSDPAGGTSAYRVTATGSGSNNALYQGPADTNTDRTYVNSLWIKRVTGTGPVKLLQADNVRDTLTLTTSWRRYSSTVKAGNSTNRFVGVSAETTGDAIDVAFAMQEEVTGQSNTNPSEYVSVGILSAPYHGANVDGVKYFDYENGNTVASNVVTEAAGAAISSSVLLGYLAEGARTNRCLQSNAFGEAVWVSGGGAIAVTDNSLAAPDGTTTADTLTASGANGTLIQDLGVVASAAKTFSIWLKRKTGTGDVDLTMDGGSTWTTVAVDADWTRFTKTQTVADEDVGIRLVTSGDAVYAWMAQVETASFASSEIPTTTIAVARNASVDQYVSAGNVGSAAGSIYVEFTPQHAPSGTIFLWGTYVDASNYTALLHDATNLIMRKRIGGVSYDATIANAFVSGTTYKCAGSWGGAGVNVYLDGTKGTGDANATAAQIGTNMQWGADGNGANQPFAALESGKLYNRALSDARLQAMTT